MSIAVHRYEATDHGAERGGGARFGRRSSVADARSKREDDMHEPRTGHVKQLHEAVNADAYQVDAGKVADAIVRRLLDGRARDVAGERPNAR